MNKKLTLFLIFNLIFLAFLHSQDSTGAKIVIFREPSQTLSGKSINVFINDSKIVSISNSSYFEYSCEPGEYNISINENPESRLSLLVEEGQTYYIRMRMVSTFWNSVPTIELFRGDWAGDAISQMRLRKIDGTKVPVQRPKNRIGINTNILLGFEQIPIINLANGEVATISFGGGLALGLKYGYEYNQKYDFALDLNYSLSTLTPPVDNAYLVFSRVNICFTPSLIIPVRGGNSSRMKIGAGLDYNFSALLDIEYVLPSGILDDVWTYKNAVGFHLSYNYELNLSSRFSCMLGLKYNYIKYQYQSSQFNNIPSPELINPDGQSIDLLCGICYHF